MTANPLAKYFRQPEIYIQLPSQGRNYAAGAIEMPDNGELAVYPMTALDEISLKTPDALFNGNATVSVIASCLPNIRDPWLMPSTDLDAVLIGIRIASYGAMMPIESTCPHCGEENEFDLDLRVILGQLQSPDYSKPITVNGLELHLRPLSYRDLHASQMQQFEDQRQIAAVSAIPDENERAARLEVILKSLTATTARAFVGNIKHIKTPDGEIVSDPAFISEFVTNVSGTVFEEMKTKIVAIRNQSALKPLKITCTNAECLKEYETDFTMDTASFFGQNS